MVQRRVVALNKEGVVAMQHGRMNQAIFSFRHAMECAKTMTRSEEAGVDGQDKPQEELHLQPVSAMASSFLSVDLVAAASPHNVFDLYAFAFVLPRHGSLVISEVAMVLVYNLGLTYHSQGLFAGRSDDRSRNACFQTAMRLYQRVFVTYTTYDSICNGTHTFRHVVALACINNLGHIFSHLGQVVKVRACASLLDHLLARSPVDKDAATFFSVGAYCAASTLPRGAAAA